jgi:tRNA U34 5-methylaminomethyl-2-thiouridine-forming methyltransferase MnmC
MLKEKNILHTNRHSLQLTQDGSYTAYSKEYGEHYHSTKDGALHESLKKHVLPASLHVKNKEEVNILDICYGLGFNTLATILYYKEYLPYIKLNIYSPELDTSLIKSLINFKYPAEFDSLKKIIEALSTKGVYKDENLFIELFLGDAREYVKKFENRFDIVYQDAFSPATNPLLWTKEYFGDIKRAMKKEGIVTTYSIALKTRLALHVNGFNVYINAGDDHRDATVASLSELKGFKSVDMAHKIACNPDVKPLSDAEL